MAEINGTIAGTITGDLFGNVIGNVYGGILNGNLQLNTSIIADDSIVITPNSNICSLLSKDTVGNYKILRPSISDGGKLMLISSLTPYAHNVVCETNGFNGKGSLGTLTFNGIIGNSVLLLAALNRWYVILTNGVTVT
jgi:hypothetical protein